MKNLYVFGNEFLEDDKLARNVSFHLKDSFKIIHCTSPDELMEAEDAEIIILDVVKGIEKTIIINDPAQIKTRSLISLHDFDLGFFLNLMKEMGIKKKVKIIGIPAEGNTELIASEVKLCI